MNVVDAVVTVSVEGVQVRHGEDLLPQLCHQGVSMDQTQGA